MTTTGVRDELLDLIRRRGPITFAEFQDACLYSPRGGFYSSRSRGIAAHFRTSPTSHPAFGALIARQLEEMWAILGRPSPFHVVEVGSGDGALARSIVDAAPRLDPAFADSVFHVAADYAPVWPSSSSDHPLDVTPQTPVDRVKARGLDPFRGITGCILSNELLDNFPVHRFAIEGGRVREIFVGVEGDRFVEVLGEPSDSRIPEWLQASGVTLADGTRGEVNLRMEEWVSRQAAALERGFVLTIDYGGLASDIYSADSPDGTLTCFRQHAVSHDPFEYVGEQDITSHVDFSALMRFGEQHGLVPAGYSLQSDFLERLGFASHLAAVDAEDLSEARREFRRIAMMALIDPEQLGDFKVLAQAKDVQPGFQLSGFATGDQP
jgi:SAM-dependent MidA family methyltransferase